MAHAMPVGPAPTMTTGLSTRPILSGLEQRLGEGPAGFDPRHEQPRGDQHPDDTHEAGLRTEIAPRPHFRTRLPDGDQVRLRRGSADRESIDGSFEEVPRNVEADRDRELARQENRQ